MTKFCKAIGCHRAIYRSRLMCGDHWRRVPRPLQLQVSTTFATWQATGRFDSDKVVDYVRAMDEAVRFVAEGEGRLARFVPELPRWERLVAARRERA